MLLGAVTGSMAVTNASAKTIKSYPWNFGRKGYSWTAPKDDAAPLYYTNAKRHGYIWNKGFTKKLHNTKNYPNRSWYVQKSFKRNGKVYYKVYGGKASGYVWHGFVKPAISKRIDTFTSDSQYTHYLKSNKSQKLSRAVLKYFPGAKVNLDASRRGAGQLIGSGPVLSSMNLDNYSSSIDLTKLEMETHDSMGNGSLTVLNALQDPILTSNADKAKQVNKILKKNGYNQNKIKSLIADGYQLGIYMNDGAGIHSGKKGYPWTIDTFTNTFSNYALVLVK